MKHPPKTEAGKGNRRLWLILLLILLVIAIVSAGWIVPSVIRRHQRKKLSIQETDISVRSLTVDGVETIEMKPPNGQSYLLIARNRQLLLSQKDELIPIAQEASDELMELFTHFSFQATVSDTTEGVPLEEMGLAPAQSSAMVQYADGNHIELYLGNNIPGTGYYYLMWSVDDGIYAVDEGMKYAFEKSADRLLPLSQPTIIPDLVASVEIENENGNFAIQIETDTEGIQSGLITKPFVYPMSADSLTSLLNGLSSFRLGSVLSHANDENAHQYGLSPSCCTIKIHQAEGFRTDTNEDGALKLIPQKAENFTFEIGEEMNGYFYPCRYGGCYYLISKYLVQTLIDFSGKEAVTKHPFSIGDSSVSRMVLRYGNQQFELIAEYRETDQQTLGEDNEQTSLYSAEYTLNGHSLSQAQMDRIVEEMNSVTVSGELPSDWSSSEEPLWTLSITSLSGKERNVKVYALNPFFSAVSIDDVFLHTLSSEIIDQFLEILSSCL